MKKSNTDPGNSVPEKKAKRTRNTAVQDARSKAPKKVRGSGFTYDEDKGRTDQSIPLDDSNTADVSKLPDLGKRNRP